MTRPAPPSAAHQTLHSAMADRDQAEQELQLARERLRLAILRERDKGATFEEIGTELGVSRGRAQQLANGNYGQARRDARRDRSVTTERERT